METEGLLDEVNWRLLVELQQNARLSYTELGRKVGLTQPAVAERVRRLEEAGVITGYHADLDLRKVGLPILAIVRVATRESNGFSLSRAVKEFPEVLECHRVTGSDSYTLKVAVSSVEHLEAFLERLVSFGQPTTAIVLSSPIRRRVVGPPAGMTNHAER